MVALRTLSARPELIVDDHGRALSLSPAAAAGVGLPGPLGRHRLVQALPTNKSRGAVLLAPARVLVDDHGCLLGDAAGNLVGPGGAIWVHRILAAAKTPNTRRL